MSTVGRAYAMGARAWADGPSRVYRHLVEALVAFSPVDLAGRSVLDLGSGTGAASHAAAAVGARAIAVDLAFEMLSVDRDHRPPAASADAVALPFRSGCFDVTLAAFSLNHLADPAVGVREAGRVSRLLVASTYAADDDHPAKAAVEQALEERGWQPPPWYPEVRAAMAAWGTVEAASAVAERGGLRPLLVERRDIELAELGPVDMVAWRMGMAQSAPFLASLSAADRAGCTERALELLGPDPAPIVRRVIFLAAN